MSMRLLLIDDEVTVTESLRLYLERDYHTVREMNWVDDQAELQRSLLDFGPQGVVLDFQIGPGGDVIYRWIREARPAVNIVFYTRFGESLEFRLRMLAAGAQGNQIVIKREVGHDYRHLLQLLGA